MPSAFAAMLDSEMHRRGMTKTTLAQQSGCGQPYVSLVIQGKRRPSLDRARVWAQALHLDQAAARRFLRLAALTHVPDPDLRGDLEQMVARDSL